MYKFLQFQGYEIGEYQKLVGYVTFNDLWDIIHDFFQDVSTKSKDTLFFYFSGHGIPDSYENYLASSQIQEKRPSRRGLAFDKLTSLTERCNSRRIIAILDCCFSGSIRVEGIKSGVIDRIGDDDTTIAKKARETMENRIKESEGLCFLASSLSYQQSLIKKNLGHSLYTYYLLEGLKGQQGYVDDNGYVTADLLSRYVYDKLIDESKDLQKPIKKSNISGDLIVAYYPNLVKKIEEQPKIDDDAEKYSTFDLIQKYIEEGKEYRYIGSYLEAIDSFDKALKINPNNLYACKIKGDVLLYNLKGREEEAILYYKRILDKNPTALQVLKDLAIAMENLSLYEDAIKYYDKVLVNDPNDEDAKKKRYRIRETYRTKVFINSTRKNSKGKFRF
jgi:tetratricopeptide (TPR) repeat protein